LCSHTPVHSPLLHSFAQVALQRLTMTVGSSGRAGDVERRGGAPLLRGCLRSSLAAPEGEVSAFHQHHTVGGAPCLARLPTATYSCVAVLERVSDREARRCELPERVRRHATHGLWSFNACEATAPGLSPHGHTSVASKTHS